MGLFRKDKVADPLDSRSRNGQLQDLRDKNRFYLSTIVRLFDYIKDFSFDLKEIDSEAFKSNIDTLTKQFETEDKTKKIKSVFDANQEDITSFICREKTYLVNKEGEFKKIIQILSQGISTLINPAIKHRVYTA